MKRKLLVIGMTGILIGGSLTGCGQKEEPTTEEITTEVATEATTTEEDTEEENEFEIIGVEDEAASQTVLMNSTGQDIIHISVFDTVTNEYSENLLPEDTVFAKDEQRILYYPLVEEEEENDKEASADEKQISVGYDIKIVLADESEYILHSFPMGNVEECSIRIEDEIAYIENDEINTKEAEIAILEAEKQASAKVSKESGSSNKQTGQAASTPAPTTQAPAPTTQEPAPAPEPVPEPAPSVDQGAEDCIGDEGLTY